MQQFLANVCTLGVDLLCVCGTQHLITKVHTQKFPHRRLALKKCLEQSVAAITLIVLVSQGLRLTSFVLSRTVSMNIALRMWLTLRTSTFYERMILLAFAWTHCLSDYVQWTVLSVHALQTLWHSAKYLPRVPSKHRIPSYVWRWGEISSVTGVLSWCVWNHTAHWSMYLYAAYLPYEWHQEGSAKEE